ncbi:MAG: DoxX family protein [Phycisphaerales bacterium]|nr:DoxX family protein [Phycisphaerales bacterium]
MSGLQSKLHDVGLLLIRVLPGVVFAYHGAQKVFGAFGGSGMEGFIGFLSSMNVPMPVVSAWAAALTEFLGGVALILGLGVRLVGWPLMFTMLVAAFMVHGKAFSAQNNGMEYPLTLAFVAAGLALTGAGRISLDALLRPRKSKAA